MFLQMYAKASWMSSIGVPVRRCVLALVVEFIRVLLRAGLFVLCISESLFVCGM